MDKMGKCLGREGGAAWQALFYFCGRAPTLLSVVRWDEVGSRYGCITWCSYLIANK